MDYYNFFIYKRWVTLYKTTYYERNREKLFKKYHVNNKEKQRVSKK